MGGMLSPQIDAEGGNFAGNIIIAVLQKSLKYPIVFPNALQFRLRRYKSLLNKGL